jgi:formylglycine-generating enzyme required for sulfatase activity
MVRLPGGTFMMGCVDGDSQCGNDEKPAHRVNLDSFYLDVHEVTVAEYAQCVNAGVCKPALIADNEYDEFYNWNKPGRKNHPVNGVDWNDAHTYCQWRGKRLPTEAEFEYALRGGSQGYIYPWGNNNTPPRGYGNYPDESAHRSFSDWSYFAGYDDGYVGTAPVCSFTRNPYGLCDISGNVWE